MRRSIIGIAAIAFASGAAVAADMPAPPMAYKAAPYQKVRDWTGFYLGVNLGGGWANTDADFSFAGGAPFANAKNSLAGFIGGGQLGYNWQSGPAVFGFETDFQYSGQKGSIVAPPCPAAICGVATNASYTESMPWFGTVRGRLGYAADGWMLYATGGYAYASLKTEAAASAGGVSAADSKTEFRSGWTIGAGAEMMLGNNWSAKVEYLYLDFGSADLSWPMPGGIPTLESRTRLYDNIVRAGLNYRF
jgi:outer membrane immunogenic protein